MPENVFRRKGRQTETTLKYAEEEKMSPSPFFSSSPSVVCVWPGGAPLYCTRIARPDICRCNCAISLTSLWLSSSLLPEPSPSIFDMFHVRWKCKASLPPTLWSANSCQLQFANCSARLHSATMVLPGASSPPTCSTSVDESFRTLPSTCVYQWRKVY